MTGFAACGACGAMQRARAKPVAAAVAASFRQSQLQSGSAGAKRRISLLLILLLVGLLCGIGYLAMPKLRLCAIAAQSVNTQPLNMQDEFQNQKIHDARKALGLE